MTVENVLALDLATRTGFAIGPSDGKPVLGLWKLEGATRGDRGLSLLRHLTAMVREHDHGTLPPLRIVYERPLEPRVMVKIGTMDPLFLYGLCMVVETVAASYGVPCRGVSVQDVRAHFVGQRTFKAGYDPERRREVSSRDMAKAAVMKRCTMLGWIAVDDNEADAAALWSYEVAHIRPAWATQMQPLFNA